MRTKNNMSEFERRFKKGESIFNIMFVVVLCFILLVWSSMIFVGYKAYSDPEGIARGAGNMIGEVMKGIEERR
jgi:cell division protein FtsL